MTKSGLSKIIASFILTLLLVVPLAPATVFADELDISLPEYSGSAYVALNDNEPLFSETEKIRTDAFEEYSQLDNLGRCGIAYANVCRDIMPTEQRGDISSIHPTGWHTGVGYNRCHLIGFQLAGENANSLNLITGTAYFNVSGMLPFENMIADYIQETDNHVLYRVTPVFINDELVARGVQMEAWSVEDSGNGICFNVYCFNVFKNNDPPINYMTGEVGPLVPKDQTITIGKSYVKYSVKKTLGSTKRFSMKITSDSGNVSCTRLSGSSRLSVSKTGTVTVKKGTKIGKYSMKVKVLAEGTPEYNKRTVTKTVNVTIAKATKKTQSITVGKSTATYKVDKTLGSTKRFSMKISTGSGQKSCSKKSGSNRLTVSKGGTVTVKKGTKPGKYSMTVKIYAKGTSKYKSRTITKTVTVKVVKKSDTSGTVYWTPTGSCYHKSKECSSLSNSKTIYSGGLSEAQENGLRPCRICY